MGPAQKFSRSLAPARSPGGRSRGRGGRGVAEFFEGGEFFGFDFGAIFHAGDDTGGRGRSIAEFFEIGVAVGGEDGVGGAGAGEEFFLFEDGGVFEAADGDVFAMGFDFETLVHDKLVGFVFFVVRDEVGVNFARESEERVDGVGVGGDDERDVALGEGVLKFAEGVEPEGELEAAGFSGGGAHPARVDNEEADERVGLLGGSK